VKNGLRPATGKGGNPKNGFDPAKINQSILKDKMPASITFFAMVGTEDDVIYKIEPVGNETGDVTISRRYEGDDIKITIDELEEDFNIFKPLSLGVALKNREYIFHFEEVVKHHSKKESVCDEVAALYRENDSDNDGSCIYGFLNSHEMFWRYCSIDKFVKKIENESSNMYWRTKVEGDCPVTMEKLKVGECCRLPCDHIISSVAYKKIKKTRGSPPLCPLCRAFVGHNETTIY